MLNPRIQAKNSPTRLTGAKSKKWSTTAYTAASITEISLTKVNDSFAKNSNGPIPPDVEGTAIARLEAYVTIVK